ncbi:putative hydrolase YugF [Tetrabaena socialis]|uniref:Putative hydrolase YugF n=1 Tax=Tetrabaena socialis TaxID=47790 RepID=A0A2J8AEA3_9CHLO|nr:putative hydrolase YugF [Tetrabaena socialis]|eukprot:PNH10844.1 putative hydrolase YugF [Tetrabaena socialis]
MPKRHTNLQAAAVGRSGCLCARLAAALMDSLVPAEAPRPRTGLVGARRGAVLVGHSAGAAVAVETALRYPDRVCGLVLISPAVTTSSRGFLARSDLGQLLRFAWTRALLSSDGPGLNYVRRQVLKRRAEVEAGRLGIYADEREVPQEVIDGFLQPLRAHDWDKGTLNVYRSFQVGGTPPALSQIRVPVLVIQGTQDRAVPLEAARQVEAAFRLRGPANSRLPCPLGPAGCVTEMFVLEGCGHVPMDEMPLEVLRAMVDFINRECCEPGRSTPL